MASSNEHAVRTIAGSRASRTAVIVVALGLIAHRRRRHRGKTEVVTSDVHVVPPEVP